MSAQRGFSPKAVLFGFLVDLGSTLVVSFVIGVVLGAILLARGATPDELNAQMGEPIVLIPSLVVGLACTVLGGFVAGRVAGHSEGLHGGLVGALGGLLVPAFMAQYPQWYNVACLVSVIPAGMLGGCLAATRRTASPPEPDGSSGGPDEANEGW